MPTARVLRVSRPLLAALLLPGFFALPVLFADSAGATPTALRTVTNPAEASGPGTPVPTVGVPSTPAPGSPAPSSPAPSSPVPPTIDISPKPPTAPADLHVTAVTATSVTLAWTAATGGCCGVAGYDISYNQAFNDVLWTQAVDDVTATITANIRPTGQYTFRVSARDDVGHRSASSNSVVVVTPASDTAADRTPPTAPANLQIVDTPPPFSPTVSPSPTGGAVSPLFTPAPGATTISWTPSTDNVAVTGYDVYRFDGLYVSTLLATVTATSYTNQTSSTASEILYVRARDAAGNLSAASNTVTTHATTTSPPPGPGCQVEYRITREWRGGFVGEATVTNTSAVAVNGWVLSLYYSGDERVLNTWNATFSQAGGLVKLTNLSWNRVIAPGGSLSVGLLGTKTTNTSPPVGGGLNGVECLPV